MRQSFSPEVEAGRFRGGALYSTSPGERVGAFLLRCHLSGAMLKVMVSDGQDWEEAGLPLPAWEHVSVSLPTRCPDWAEMCWVKDLFFGPEECVVQFHPPEFVRVNIHPFCLHLWKVVGVEFPAPPSTCV